MTPEGKIEAYLVKRVRETGGKIRKLKWIGHNGAPDRMAWWPDALTPLIIFPEVKAPDGRCSKAQIEEHRKMRADGLRVVVLDSKDEVDNFIRVFAKQGAFK